MRVKSTRNTGDQAAERKRCNLVAGNIDTHEASRVLVVAHGHEGSSEECARNVEHDQEDDHREDEDQVEIRRLAGKVEPEQLRPGNARQATRPSGKVTAIDQKQAENFTKAKRCNCKVVTVGAKRRKADENAEQTRAERADRKRNPEAHAQTECQKRGGVSTHAVECRVAEGKQASDAERDFKTERQNHVQKQHDCHVHNRRVVHKNRYQPQDHDHRAKLEMAIAEQFFQFHNAPPQTRFALASPPPKKPVGRTRSTRIRTAKEIAGPMLEEM